jgi:glutaredoxin
MSVVVYVKPGCPHCQPAREDLAATGESVQERDASRNAAWKAQP